MRPAAQRPLRSPRPAQRTERERGERGLGRRSQRRPGAAGLPELSVPPARAAADGAAAAAWVRGGHRRRPPMQASRQPGPARVGAARAWRPLRNWMRAQAAERVWERVPPPVWVLQPAWEPVPAQVGRRWLLPIPHWREASRSPGGQRVRPAARPRASAGLASRREPPVGRRWWLSARRWQGPALERRLAWVGRLGRKSAQRERSRLGPTLVPACPPGEPAGRDWMPPARPAGQRQQAQRRAPRSGLRRSALPGSGSQRSRSPSRASALQAWLRPASARPASRRGARGHPLAGRPTGPHRPGRGRRRSSGVPRRGRGGEGGRGS